MADPNPNAGSIGVAYSSSSSQPTPPNLATHARLHATLGIPQVISPNIQGQSTMVDKVLIGLSRWVNVAILMSRFSG